MQRLLLLPLGHLEEVERSPELSRDFVELGAPPEPFVQTRFGLLVDGNDSARTQQQESEQRALLRSRRREIDAVGFHLEPARQSELHLVTIVTPTAR